GNLGIGTTAPLAGLHLIAPAAATKGLVVRGAAGQSASLQEWQNSGGSTLASVNSGGGAFFPTAGIGNITPQAGTALYVRQAFGNPPGNSFGVTVAPNIAPTAAASVSVYGVNIASSISGAVGTSGSVYGAYGQSSSSVPAGGTVSALVGGRFFSINNSSGVTSSLYGGHFNTYNQGGGTASNQYAAYFTNNVTANSKVTNVFGAYITTPNISGGGTATNAYGLYVQNVTGATSKNFAIYSAGGTNYFAGSVGIGISTPAANLEVNGTAKFDGLVTFASSTTAGGTFTGASGTTAGYPGVDATGGGTSQGSFYGTAYPGAPGVKGTGGAAVGSNQSGGDGVLGIGGGGVH